MIEVTEKPIEVEKVLQSVVTEKSGGFVHFIGSVRQEKGISGLDYECYPAMARSILVKIMNEAKQRWKVERMAIVHRYGWVAVGESSVVIAVAAEHRREAFAACEFVIEEIKKKAPIWKRERFSYVQNS
ncbi:MAG: molybdenum cofactor biosynthesis protein MoaE [Deltaproteobacteria bacterium]|nr:molybdenum cofactor biosynthesis protein MoaE [Deltaproteobacteria bacterium]